jgi:hypothetical protein
VLFVRLALVYLSFIWVTAITRSAASFGAKSDQYGLIKGGRGGTEVVVAPK